MTPQIDLIATFSARDGAVEEVTRLIAGYREEVVREPGNLRFEVYREQDPSRRFVVVERYRDRDAFEAHLGSPANAAFNAALAPHVEGAGSDLLFMTPVGTGS